MTVPSGMWTSRSMMACRIRQCRPMLPWAKMMDESTSAYELTRTSCESTELRTTDPEMMQPAETTELMAMPVRPGSPKTNLAGGYWYGRVRMGQDLSYRLNTGEIPATSILASK